MRKFEAAILTLGTEKAKLETEVKELQVDVKNGEIDENMVTMLIESKKAEIEELEEAIETLGGAR